jgi:hypothetical protein
MDQEMYASPAVRSKLSRRRRGAPARLLAGSFSLALLLGLLGCTPTPIPVNDPSLNALRYLRYTIRAEQVGYYRQTHRSNILVHPVAFRPGQKVELTMYSAERLDMNIDGLPCKMVAGEEKFPTHSEGISETLDKYFALSAEEVTGPLSRLEAATQRQINEGIAAIQMTKEEVLMALGYPSHIDDYVIAAPLPKETIFASNQWLYRSHFILWVPAFHIYQFDNNGRLANVIR